LDAIQDVMREIDGWLTEREGAWLFSAARDSKAAIVEIGSWKGRSTACLGLGSLAGQRAPVFAIDPHHGSAEHTDQIGAEGTFPEFSRNIERAGVGEIVRPLLMTSADAVRDWDRPIGLLFVDGSHEYDHVSDDLRRWLPHMMEGGLVAVHDCCSRPGEHWATGWPGPRRAAREHLLGRGTESARLVDTMLVARRVDHGNIPRSQRWRLTTRQRALQFEHAVVHDVGRHLPRWLRQAGRQLVNLAHNTKGNTKGTVF
jgi:predicted O-methyltransferase YrrM